MHAPRGRRRCRVRRVREVPRGGARREGCGARGSGRRGPRRRHAAPVRSEGAEARRHRHAGQRYMLGPIRRRRATATSGSGPIVDRDAQPAGNDRCAGGWFRVRPHGYVCANQEMTFDLNHPLVRAASVRPDTTKPLPYKYAFMSGGCAALPSNPEFGGAEESRIPSLLPRGMVGASPQRGDARDAGRERRSGRRPGRARPSRRSLVAVASVDRAVVRRAARGTIRRRSHSVLASGRTHHSQRRRLQAGSESVLREKGVAPHRARARRQFFAPAPIRATADSPSPSICASCPPIG